MGVGEQGAYPVGAAFGGLAGCVFRQRAGFVVAGFVDAQVVDQDDVAALAVLADLVEFAAERQAHGFRHGGAVVLESEAGAGVVGVEPDEGGRQVGAGDHLHEQAGFHADDADPRVFVEAAAGAGGEQRFDFAAQQVRKLRALGGVVERIATRGAGFDEGLQVVVAQEVVELEAKE